jgi:GNAT superfamily N-acetyltransferase
MIIFKEIDYLKATGEDWERMHKFRREYNNEVSPEDTLVTDETWELFRINQAKNNDRERYNYEIYEDEKLAGMLSFSYFTETAPSYKGNEKIVNFNLEILERHRRKGIGSKALKLLEQKCDQKQKKILITETFVPEAKKFFESLGAKVGQVATDNVLKVKNIDKDMLKEWIQEGEKKNPKTTIKTVVNRIPEEEVEEFCKSFTEAAKDEPKDDLEKGDEIFTVRELREKEAEDQKVGAKIITTYTIEEDKTISGFSVMKSYPGREKQLLQSLTGVLARHRGRKLGKWVKAKTLLYALEIIPEAEEIITGNADSNESMLYINKKMGFKKVKEFIFWQITLEQLKKYLEEKKIGLQTVLE